MSAPGNNEVEPRTMKVQNALKPKKRMIHVLNRSGHAVLLSLSSRRRARAEEMHRSLEGVYLASRKPRTR